MRMKNPANLGVLSLFRLTPEASVGVVTRHRKSLKKVLPFWRVSLCFFFSSRLIPSRFVVWARAMCWTGCWFAVVVLVHCFLPTPGVNGGWQESADATSASLEEIINERAGAKVMQDVIVNTKFTLANVSGSVQTAAFSTNIGNIVRKKTEILEKMYDCVTYPSLDSRRRRAQQKRQLDDNTTQSGDTNSGFEKSGIFSSDGWGVDEAFNIAESECLNEIWEESAAEDDSLVLQHYTGASGYIRGYFSDPDLNEQMRNSPDQFDARLTPSFVYASTYQKDVLLLLDQDAPWEYVQQMKEGARAIISGLYVHDYAQIITSSELTNIESSSCGVGKLLRMTESNKILLNDVLDSIDANYSGSHKSIEDLFREAFDSLAASTTSGTNANSDCQPIFVFPSARDPTTTDRSYIRNRNSDFGARIFTYSLGSATDPKGWVGGGQMYQISCDNEGQWFDGTDATKLPQQMLQYMLLVQESREISPVNPIWFTRSYSYGQTSKGIGLVGSLPVYTSTFTSDNMTVTMVSGVLTIEFSLSEIQAYLETLSRGLSFAFLTTDQGDLLLHPSYRDPNIVEQLPLFYDCSLIESSQNFMDFVRRPLVERVAGDTTIVVNRPLSRGEIGSEGITSVPLKTNFFWNRVQSIPFILVLAYTDAELRAPSFEATRDSDWSLSCRTEPLYTTPGVADEFLPPDFFDDFQVDLFSTGSSDTFHLKYSTAADNYRTATPTFSKMALASAGPDGKYPADSYMRSLPTMKNFQSYLNNMITPEYSENPGLLPNVKQSALMTTILNKYWREDYVQSCIDQPDICVFMFRYVGFSDQLFVNFPGTVDVKSSRIANSPTYLCGIRPWYQRAQSNPGLTTISTPYLDALFGGKISTVAKAVFADPTRPEDDREMLGVVAIDYPYEIFHRTAMEQASCAYDRNSVSATVPMCYLMDTAAIVVVSPDFLRPEYTTLGVAKSDSLPIFFAEPELGEQLVNAGVISVSNYRNFKGTIEWLVYDANGKPESLVTIDTDIVQDNPIYTVNNTVLAENGGFFSGTLSMADGYCSSGFYTIAPVEGSSQYLIYIENYVNEERDDCRTYSPGEKMNVTDITTCGENDKDYPRDLPVCPNADRRASETERNRQINSKCDEDPPKEQDFVDWDDEVAIAMISINCILIVLCVIILAIIFKYKDTAVIKMASPVFIYLQFFGFILGMSTIFLWTGKPTDVQCGLRPWIASIAYVLIVGPMFAKTYRVWKLFSGKGFFAQKLSDMTVLSYVLGMMVPPLILCIIWTAVEIPEPRLEDDHFDNDKIVYRCDGDSCRIFEGVMIAYCGCLLAMGTFFAFQARKAVSHFNEAKYIGLAIYTISCCGIVGVTLTYVLLGLPIAYYVVFCVVVWLGVYSTILFVYVPKIRICLFKPEKNVYLRSSATSSGSINPGSTIQLSGRIRPNQVDD